MSFEEEWVADKAAVTMKLDQADSTGGSTPPSGSADYVVEDDDLGEIGHAAHGLFDGLEPAGKHANAASESAGSSLKGDGFDAGAALSEVNKTWETRVKTLLQACAHISNHLDFASDVHQILGKNIDGHTTFNDLDIDRGDLTRVIRGVAEDPKAFGVIHHSQSVVIADGLNSFPEDSNRRQDPQLRAWVKQSASVLGHLDGVRGDVIYDLGQAQRDANVTQTARTLPDKAEAQLPAGCAQRMGSTAPYTTVTLSAPSQAEKKASWTGTRQSATLPRWCAKPLSTSLASQAAHEQEVPGAAGRARGCGGGARRCPAVAQPLKELRAQNLCLGMLTETTAGLLYDGKGGRLTVDEHESGKSGADPVFSTICFVNRGAEGALRTGRSTPSTPGPPIL